MEILKARYKDLLQAYKRLQYMISRYKKALEKSDEVCDIENDCLAFRDSVIKRFEFCYDVTWKFLKLYLEKNYGTEVASPKKVFQECFKQKIVNSKEVELLIEMADARNYTSHTYDESIADQIVGKIPKYNDILMDIIQRIKV